MPIEIRELVITTSVQQSSSAASTAAASPSSTVNTEAIVAACVEQVMEILRQKNER
jgi:hypothetical protein